MQLISYGTNVRNRIIEWYNSYVIIPINYVHLSFLFIVPSSRCSRLETIKESKHTQHTTHAVLLVFALLQKKDLFTGPMQLNPKENKWWFGIYEQTSVPFNPCLIIKHFSSSFHDAYSQHMNCFPDIYLNTNVYSTFSSSLVILKFWFHHHFVRISKYIWVKKPNARKFCR